jgi:hypothetical protein
LKKSSKKLLRSSRVAVSTRLPRNSFLVFSKQEHSCFFLTNSFPSPPLPRTHHPATLRPPIPRRRRIP